MVRSLPACSHGRQASGERAVRDDRYPPLAASAAVEQHWAFRPEPQLVSELYLAAYNRLPAADELREALRYFSLPGISRQTALEDLAWSLINSAEFVFNH